MGQTPPSTPPRGAMTALGRHVGLPVHLDARLPFPAATTVPSPIVDALALDPDPLRRPGSIGDLLLSGPSIPR